MMYLYVVLWALLIAMWGWSCTKVLKFTDRLNSDVGIAIWMFYAFATIGMGLVFAVSFALKLTGELHL